MLKNLERLAELGSPITNIRGHWQRFDCFNVASRGTSQKKRWKTYQRASSWDMSQTPAHLPFVLVWRSLWKWKKQSGTVMWDWQNVARQSRTYGVIDCFDCFNVASRGASQKERKKEKVKNIPKRSELRHASISCPSPSVLVCSLWKCQWKKRSDMVMCDLLWQQWPKIRNTNTILLPLFKPQVQVQSLSEPALLMGLVFGSLTTPRTLGYVRVRCGRVFI
jgi:hypothetical protein